MTRVTPDPSTEALHCEQYVGENTTYWPCSLPEGHDGPHEWDKENRLRWERDVLAARLSQAEELRALLVELARWSHVATRNGDLHARVASALALFDLAASSSGQTDA